MKILYLSLFFPYPLDTGARIRSHYLLRALASHHTVHLISFLWDQRGEAYLPTLREWCERVDVVRRNPFERHPVKALLGHFSYLPRDVIACHSEEMEALVRGAVERESYDLVIPSIMNNAPYVLRARKTRRLLEEHNFYTTWMEERYRAQPPGVKKLAAWLTWQKCLRYERSVYPRFDAITVVSERDRDEVERIIPECAGRVFVVPNGVDTEDNCPGSTPAAPHRLVFNGTMTYSANLDAMRFFLAEIFPIIKTRNPLAELVITGSTEGVDLSPLQAAGRVHFTGFLPDVRPAIAGSWACVAPLREGGGTRLKILQAMALGTPVVATSKGAEGLAVTPGEDILIADDPREFARQTLRLLDDAGLRQRLARNARALVEAKYSWARIGGEFCNVVEGLAHEV